MSEPDLEENYDEDPEQSMEEYEQKAMDCESEFKEAEQEDPDKYNDDGQMNNMDHCDGPLGLVLRGLMKALDHQILKIARRAAQHIPNDSLLGQMLEKKRELEQKISDLEYEICTGRHENDETRDDDAFS